MNHPIRTTILGMTAGALAGLTLGHLAPAGAAVQQCGGQSWHAQAPLVCTKTRVIQGTAVTITLSETANGFMTINYRFAAPRATDSLIHATSHSGNSDAGGPSTDPVGIIRAGQTTGTLIIPVARCGQTDVRAILDNKAGRVSGPYINNDTCSPVETTTTIIATSVATSSPSTTPVSVPPGPSSPTTTPGTVRYSVPGTITGGTLPPTGTPSADRMLADIGALALFSGLALLAAFDARRKDTPS